MISGPFFICLGGRKKL